MSCTNIAAYAYIHTDTTMVNTKLYLQLLTHIYIHDYTYACTHKTRYLMMWTLKRLGYGG